MQAQHQSSSVTKANTSPAQDGCSPLSEPRRLLATAVIGAALIGYLVHKTPDARVELESLTTLAMSLGELTKQDAAVVAQLLAEPTAARSTAFISQI